MASRLRDTDGAEVDTQQQQFHPSMDVGLLSKAMAALGLNPGHGKLAAAAAAAYAATAHMMPPGNIVPVDPSRPHMPISVFLQLMQNISKQCCKQDDSDDIMRAMKDYASQVMSGQIPLDARMYMGHATNGLNGAHADMCALSPAAHDAAGKPSNVPQSSSNGVRSGAVAPTQPNAAAQTLPTSAAPAGPLANGNSSTPSQRAPPSNAATANPPAVQNAAAPNGTAALESGTALDVLRLAGFAPDAFSQSDLQAIMQQADMKALPGLDDAAAAGVQHFAAVQQQQQQQQMHMMQASAAQGHLAAPIAAAESVQPTFLQSTVSPFLQHPYVVLDQLQQGAHWRQPEGPPAAAPPAMPQDSGSQVTQQQAPGSEATPAAPLPPQRQPAATPTTGSGAASVECARPPRPPNSATALQQPCAARDISVSWQGVLDILINAGPQQVQGSAALFSSSAGGGSTQCSTEDIKSEDVFSVKSEDVSGGEGSAGGSNASPATSKSSKRSKKKKGGH